MSAIVRTKRRKNLPVSTTALWLVLGLAVTFFVVRYGQELLLARDLNDRAAIQRVDNAKLQDQNARLQAQLQYFQSDKYIEQRAREDLNLRRPDEEVLIPVEASPVAGTQDSSTSPSGTANSDSATPQATTEASKANWQKWLDLFTTGP